MRPRVFPAENVAGARRAAIPYLILRFNEAAGIPRGKPKDAPALPTGIVVLQ